MAATAAYGLLRWGELAALTLAQVDQVARVVTVDRKVVEVAGHLYLEAPKNREFPPDDLSSPHAWRLPVRRAACCPDRGHPRRAGGRHQSARAGLPSPGGKHWRSSKRATAWTRRCTTARWSPLRVISEWRRSGATASEAATGRPARARSVSRVEQGARGAGSRAAVTAEGTRGLPRQHVQTPRPRPGRHGRAGSSPGRAWRRHRRVTGDLAASQQVGLSVPEQGQVCGLARPWPACIRRPAPAPARPPQLRASRRQGRGRRAVDQEPGRNGSIQDRDVQSLSGRPVLALRRDQHSPGGWHERLHRCLVRGRCRRSAAHMCSERLARRAPPQPSFREYRQEWTCCPGVASILPARARHTPSPLHNREDPRLSEPPRNLSPMQRN
jgi:hypothetical protein